MHRWDSCNGNCYGMRRDDVHGDYMLHEDHVEILARHDREVEAATKVKLEWEALYNDRHQHWREARARLDAIVVLLKANGCDCPTDANCVPECAPVHGIHSAVCDRCLACRVEAAIRSPASEAG